MNRGMSRREFVRFLGLAGTGMAGARPGFAIGERTKLVLAELDYPGADLTSRSGALERLSWELGLRTSVVSGYRVATPRIESRELFETPFVHMGGQRGFPPWSESALLNMRRFLEFGGFLLIDDASGHSGSEFDGSVRREAARLFPDLPLTRLADDHSVFRSFYLLRGLGGRVHVSPFLEGVSFDQRTPLIYCRNDLAGAWARDNYGEWRFDCVPGGSEQRDQAFALGVNAVVYSLTVNYKQDQIHLPFILERMRR